MGRQGHDTSAPAPGMRIQRSQSKMSLSASFEALAVYFPCMNSFDEEDGGKMTMGEMDLGLAARCWAVDHGEKWCRLKDVISLSKMLL